LRFLIHSPSEKKQPRASVYFLSRTDGAYALRNGDWAGGELTSFRVSGDSIYLEGRYGQVYNMLQPGTAICNPL